MDQDVRLYGKLQTSKKRNGLIGGANIAYVHGAGGPFGSPRTFFLITRRTGAKAPSSLAIYRHD